MSIPCLLSPINDHHGHGFQKLKTYPVSRTPVPLECPKMIHPANGLPTLLEVNQVHRRCKSGLEYRGDDQRANT
jgi:hypothetical protein